MRLEDLVKTRGERTFIMVFTDGKSNFNRVEAESKLLHPLVDEVYAFGIGNGVNVRELEAIASDPDNWALMQDFSQYREFVRLFMLGLSDGCAASVIQPYRIIDLETTNHLSFGRCRALCGSNYDEYPKLNCEGNCPGHPEYDRDQNCVECSNQIAVSHLQDMEVFKQNITEAATAKCFNAALLAGFISRQTQAGKLLQSTNGWIPCDNSANGNCYGIMHMNNMSMNIISAFSSFSIIFSANIPITTDGIGGVEYLKQGIDKLIHLIDEIVVKHSAWDIVQQTRGGIGPRLQDKSELLSRNIYI